MHDWEREIEQTLIVSVEMAADVRQAAASDDLADALDYSAVAETIAAVLREGKFGRRRGTVPTTWSTADRGLLGNSVLASLLESMSGPTTRAGSGAA